MPTRAFADWMQVFVRSQCKACEYSEHYWLPYPISDDEANRLFGCLLHPEKSMTILWDVRKWRKGHSVS